MIPIKIEDITIPIDLQIKDTFFDDCYILKNKFVCFKTPDYNVIISASSEENYLQVFTPKKANVVAIESITGPSNSFNNKLGLLELKPKKTYAVEWAIKLKDDE
jgi:aldose 1-epimerase